MNNRKEETSTGRIDTPPESRDLASGVVILQVVVSLMGVLIFLSTWMPLWNVYGHGTSGWTILTSVTGNRVLYMSGSSGNWCLTGIWSLLIGLCLIMIGIMSIRRGRTWVKASVAVSATAVVVALIARLPRGPGWSGTSTAIGGWLFIWASVIALGSSVAVVVLELNKRT